MRSRLPPTRPAWHRARHAHPPRSCCSPPPPLPASGRLPFRLRPARSRLSRRRLRAEARRSGISPGILQQAFAGLQPNPKVLELDRNQPEFTMTWEQYRGADRLAAADRRRPARLAATTGRCCRRSRAGSASIPRVVVGIWGLEIQFRHQDRAATAWWRRWRRSPGKAAAPSFFRSPAHGQPAHPGPSRHHAAAHDRELGGRDGPAAIHAATPISASRWISTATDAATSGTAGRTRSAPSPITSPAPAGARASPGASRSLAPAGFDPIETGPEQSPPARRMDAAGRAPGGWIGVQPARRSRAPDPARRAEAGRRSSSIANFSRDPALQLARSSTRSRSACSGTPLRCEAASRSSCCRWRWPVASCSASRRPSATRRTTCWARPMRRAASGTIRSASYSC